MNINILCSGCGKQFDVPGKYLGHRVPCPVCKSSNRVPATLPSDSNAPPAQSQPVNPLAGQGANATPSPPIPSTTPSPGNSGSSNAARFEPYLKVDGIRDPKNSQIPNLESVVQLMAGESEISSYRIRILNPKFPWKVFLLLPALPLIPLILLVIIGRLIGHFFRRRGHAYLYLTNHRVVVLELDEGKFGKSQTVLNYEVDSITGFGVYAQQGVKRFLNLFTILEKKAFFLAIKTNTSDSFSIGSNTQINGNFYPGADAVNLCSELDTKLLAIKSKLRPRGGKK